MSNIKHTVIYIRRAAAARMVGATTLLRTTRALHSEHLPSPSSSSTSSSSFHPPPLKFPSNGGAGRSSQARQRTAVSLETTVLLPETKQKPSFPEGFGISHLSSLADAARRLLNSWKPELKHWRPHAEVIIERVHTISFVLLLQIEPLLSFF